MQDHVLSNGCIVPPIGYGTGDHTEPEFVDSIVTAVKAGYRLIDTAFVYQTEIHVGQAVKRLLAEGFHREDLFIQTKFYPQMPYGREEVLSQFEESLRRLDLDYVDSYLIHQPVPRYSELTYRERNIAVWEAMEQLYLSGKVRAIGVSNFLERHILQLESACEIKPMINQLEINPLYQQRGLSTWCREHGMVVQAWGPLSKGGALEEQPLMEISEKHGVSVSQVCLRWNQQMNSIPICISAKPERIRQNIDLSFDLDEEDLEKIRLCNSNTAYRKTWWYPRQQMY